MTLGDQYDLVLRLSAQMPGEVQILAGEVLVNAKHFHLYYTSLWVDRLFEQWRERFD